MIVTKTVSMSLAGFVLAKTLVNPFYDGPGYVCRLDGIPVEMQIDGDKVNFCPDWAESRKYFSPENCYATNGKVAMRIPGGRTLIVFTYRDDLWNVTLSPKSEEVMVVRIHRGMYAGRTYRDGQLVDPTTPAPIVSSSWGTCTKAP